MPADHDVRRDAPVVDGELLAGPSEAAHHLVGDEQYPVLPADLRDARPVAVRRHDRARRGPDDGLGEERGDGVRPLAENDFFELVGGFLAAVVLGAPERAFEAVVGAHLREVEEQRLVALAARLVPADGHRRQRDAVIRDLAADDFPALGPACGDVVQPRQADGGVDRLRPAAGEAGAGHALGQPALRQALDERASSLLWRR